MRKSFSILLDTMHLIWLYPYVSFREGVVGETYGFPTLGSTLPDSKIPLK
jgi:hypothetical protein